MASWLGITSTIRTRLSTIYLKVGVSTKAGLSSVLQRRETLNRRAPGGTAQRKPLAFKARGSHMALARLAIGLTIYLLVRVLEKGLLERCFPCHEFVCKAEDLKTVVSTDDPNMQLTPVLLVGRNLDKARVTS
jgi:hypothetical protein